MKKRMWEELWIYGKEFLWRLMQADKFPVGVTKHKLSTLNKSLLLELVKIPMHSQKVIISWIS